MGQTEDLVAAVAAEDTVIDSAIVLMQTLLADLNTANNTGAPNPAVQKVIDDTIAKTAEIAKAVVTNTPAATPPPPPKP